MDPSNINSYSYLDDTKLGKVKQEEEEEKIVIMRGVESKKKKKIKKVRNESS